ncbi:tripartite tricarboxylate transporter TctB family protein [Pseudogracilibacillus sp. SE30717A]|uniref:tripartite tricarboxylate transporter TctB family protein n=1 Tax=Pseudogracilibacillus sp. SE30717A TaxID=3098293 RepID=UPI00300DE0A9
MKKGNIIASLISIGIGICFIYLSKDFPKEVSNAPGPGFYPSFLGVILIILGVFLLIQNLIDKNKEDVSLALGSKKARFIYKVIGIVTLYAIVLPFIGFIATTFSFMIVMCYLMGLRSYKLLLIIPLGVTTVVFLIFNMVFKVPLPSQTLF